MTDILAPITRHIVYPAWMAKDKSSEVGYLKKLRKSQYLPTDELDQSHWNRLSRILQHAYENVPFYANRFNGAGISPADIRSPADLHLIPLLTKSDIQSNGNSLIAENVDTKKLIPDSTGGSTGAPIRFFYDHDRHALRQAAALRHNEWANWYVGDKAAVLWAAPRDIPEKENLKKRIRRTLLDRQIILDAAGLTDERMMGFVGQIRKFRPKILLGYSNTMDLFSSFVNERGIDDLGVTSIVCSAEVLTEGMRRRIAAVFDCPVFNRYGSREFSVIASECETQQGMHLNHENLHVEIVDKGGRAVDGIGDIIVTDMMNYAMPMIRYQIGDIGESIGGDCPCGRTLPRISLTEGRSTDFLITSTGTAISGVAISTYLLPNVSGLRRAQFVQSAPGSVTVRVVFDHYKRDSAFDSLLSALDSFFGTDIETKIEEVSMISPEVSGKFRFIKSTVDPKTILESISRSNDLGDRR